MKDIFFTNDRLALKNLTDKDLESLIMLREDDKVYRFEPTFLFERQGSAEEALKQIQSMDLKKDLGIILGIYEVDAPDTLVGLAELYDYKPSGKVVSIGYRLLSKVWGRGIGSSTVDVILNFIKKYTDVELVTAHVIPDNKASSRCLTKNGFKYLLTKDEDWGYEELKKTEVYTYDINK